MHQIDGIHVEATRVKIGFDLLQLISSSMYVEPLTLYREYVQNAADSIEQAKLTGILSVSDSGFVEISPDALTRSIKIRDNGSGISNDRFAATLVAIGASPKRGQNLRGFRGIGRLVGLGYCQELSFRSRSSLSEEVLELTWNCRLLRETLRSASSAEVQEVISAVVTTRTLNGIEWPAHFFEVELKGVIRHLDDQLLNHNEIERYLCQVAPVPFGKAFTFGAEIVSKLREKTTVDQLEINLNGSRSNMLRPYKDETAVSVSKAVRVSSLETFEVPALDEGVAAVGWIAHHDYLGSFPRGTLIGGIRVRDGNVQIGDASLLDPIFKEPRFNSWCIGEVHVIDRRIIPNGRRDNFEANVHYGNLLNHLAPLARELSRRCRTSSIARNVERNFSSCEGEVQRIVTSVSKRDQKDVMLLSASSRLSTLLVQMLGIVERYPDLSEREILIRRYESAKREACRIEAKLERRGRAVSARTRGQLDVLEMAYEVTQGHAASNLFMSRLLDGLEERLRERDTRARKRKA